MSIEPDGKDWTWVLGAPCPECGFEATSFDIEHLPALLRANAGAWDTVLRRADARLRPDDTTWSPLEYACHVRDVFRLYDVRLALMLGEEDPLFANWDQDATAIEERYDQQDPAVVLVELEAAGESLAGAFDAVGDEQWARPGRRSDGASFTVESFGRYLLHDPVHHLWDVQRA